MDIKNANSDCIVLFRMGDFYETFFEDAKTISRELEITLTSRGKGETKAPLAGIPYHSIDPYIAKLVKKGYKVAMVEQTEDPKLAKGLVKRDLVRIITPGTVVESMMLNEKNNNYIVSFVKDKNVAICVCDVSTGEFKTSEVTEKQFINELKRLNPAEIIYPMSLEESQIIMSLSFNLNSFDDRHFYGEKAKDTLKQHFKVMNLEGFGKFSELMLSASGALIAYLKETQMNSLNHITKIQNYSVDSFMHLDSSTIRNLELNRNIMNNSEDSTLVSVLDKTVTPMGKRLIRNWVTAPLKNSISINERLNAVDALKNNLIKRGELLKHLDDMYDMERLIARVSFGNASPKDLVALKLSLREIPKIKSLLCDEKTELLKKISQLPELSEPENKIETAIKDEPNTIIREGNIIRKGYSNELDELRLISTDGKKFLADLEEKEKERSGIKSLKIKFNRVFGYFIEVTKSNLHLVPENYIRKQTQANSERYITEELKEMESKILGAEEKIVQLEYDLFFEVLNYLKSFIESIQDVAKKLAALDCLISFAQVSGKNNYCKPQINEEGILKIEEGRHPVIEEFADVNFVPNNCTLNLDNNTMLITGPNMSGKSTYMRQNALIALMAQIGCFVPCKQAQIPIFDRIFTRVGAYDDLVSGQSTFMVEMNEAANILNNATNNSLIIIDEIGRGTSTYDGLSLAWAIAEYIHKNIKAKTLFATHYHHLNKLALKYPGIKNYNVVVDESNDNITFLHKIVEGGTDKSYGIQVARLAGIPESVVNSAKKVMGEVEKEVKTFDKIEKKSFESEKDNIVKKEVVSLNDFILKDNDSKSN